MGSINEVRIIRLSFMVNPSTHDPADTVTSPSNGRIRYWSYRSSLYSSEGIVFLMLISST